EQECQFIRSPAVAARRRALCALKGRYGNNHPHAGRLIDQAASVIEHAQEEWRRGLAGNLRLLEHLLIARRSLYRAMFQKRGQHLHLVGEETLVLRQKVAPELPVKQSRRGG